MGRRWIVFSMVLLSTIGGCVDSIPNEPYFDKLLHRQRTLSDGVISFVPSQAWSRWDAGSKSDILGYRMLAKHGECTGQLRIESRIPYSVARTKAGYELKFGSPPGVLCRVPSGAETAKVWLYPSYSPLPLFDPDEPRLDAEISIVLIPKVH